MYPYIQYTGTPIYFRRARENFRFDLLNDTSLIQRFKKAFLNSTGTPVFYFTISIIVPTCQKEPVLEFGQPNSLFPLRIHVLWRKRRNGLLMSLGSRSYSTLTTKSDIRNPGRASKGIPVLRINMSFSVSPTENKG